MPLVSEYLILYINFIPSAEVRCSVQFTFACAKEEVFVRNKDEHVLQVVHGAFAQFDLEAVDPEDIEVQKDGRKVNMDDNIRGDGTFVISKHSYKASQNKTYQFQVTKLNANKLKS